MYTLCATSTAVKMKFYNSFTGISELLKFYITYYLLIIWSELYRFIGELGIKVIQTKFSGYIWFKWRHHLFLLHLRINALSDTKNELQRIELFLNKAGSYC